MNRMAQDVARLVGPSRNFARRDRWIVDGRLRRARVLQTVSIARARTCSGRHARAGRHRRSKTNARSTGRKSSCRRHGRHRRCDVAEVADTGDGQQTSGDCEACSRHDVEDQTGRRGVRHCWEWRNATIRLRCFRKISSPTLILVGAEDAITPVADSEKMHHAIAGSRLVVLENAGHVSNLERTEQFNEDVDGFFERVRRLSLKCPRTKNSRSKSACAGATSMRRALFFTARTFTSSSLPKQNSFAKLVLHYGTMFDELKIWLPRVHLECDFHRAAQLDDLLEVSVYVGRFGTKSMRLNFEVRRKGTKSWWRRRISFWPPSIRRRLKLFRFRQSCARSWRLTLQTKIK